MGYKSYQPLGDKYIVLPKEKQEEIINGIIIPGTANADLDAGIVVEAPKEFEQHVKSGDEIIFSKGSGVGMNYHGKPHVILNLRDIWGVVKES